MRGAPRHALQSRRQARLTLRAQASSGSHPEGCGLGDSGSPRAASAQTIRYDVKGVRVVSRVSLNRRRGIAALVSRVNASCASRCTEPAGSRGTEPSLIGVLGATVTLRDRGDSVVAPRLRSPRESADRGAGTHDAELHSAERASSAPLPSAFARHLRNRVGPSRAGRRATAECAGVESVEAGDGLTAMPPLILRSPRERLASNERLRDRPMVVHERALLPREGPRRGGRRWTRSGASVLE